MPTLEWIGKDKVINHHQQVPFRVLERHYSYDRNGRHDEDNGSENMVINGDNLEALKALLPSYDGKVKCIYIDPPYNTGNEGWVYNDNVNSPKMRKWLGEVVGKEGDDLSRHDKWLCMMYPRLKLLYKLLSDSGAIFISLDDNEIIYLRAIMDEIFGNAGFVAQVTLLCNPKGRSQDKYFANCHEYLLVYTKSVLPIGSFSVAKDDSKIQKDYKLSDSNGAYRLLELRNTHREFGKANRPNLWYPIFVSPNGAVSLEQTAEYNEAVFPYWPDGFEGCWTWGKDLFQKDIHLLVGQQKKGVWKIYRKSYAVSADGETAKQKPFSIWNNPLFYTEKGQVAFGQIFPGANKNDFPQPKSVEYIAEIIRTITSGDDIVLDSFAGSGTTAHAVLKLNKQDGGNRKFILVEMMDYADLVTAERAKRVISGYADVAGAGGDFSYYDLGEMLLLPDGNLNEGLDDLKIREYVYYMETKEPLPLYGNIDNKYYLGRSNDTAYYFYYEKNDVTTLDHSFLITIGEKADGYIIYADICTLSESELKHYNVTFKKIPRDIVKL
ncbi:MAG: Type restriction-modification system methylation subunit [Firmicutes bacterium]|nr:Type restriction-modification system methylation subunit [Bacillota bacterium]